MVNRTLPSSFKHQIWQMQLAITFCLETGQDLATPSTTPGEPLHAACVRFSTGLASNAPYSGGSGKTSRPSILAQYCSNLSQ